MPNFKSSNHTKKDGPTGPQIVPPAPHKLLQEAVPEQDSPTQIPDFICISTAFRRLLLQAEVTGSRLRLASIEGEAGTGKHLFAQTVHLRSSLARLPFRRRDAREWLATEADTEELTGTLYLDRVDLLSSTAQNLLLNLVRCLPDMTSGTSTAIQFRLFVSSHIPLRQLATEGRFSPDLAFRLSAVRFWLPPLREHREDIAPIAQSLIDRICRHYQQPAAALAQGTLPLLLQHPWPGNVRELASTLESAILESESGIIYPRDLAVTLTPAMTTIRPGTCPDARTHSEMADPSLLAAPTQSDLSLDAIIHRHIQHVLELNRGNKLRAARQLGISRSTLYRLLAGDASIPTIR